MRNCLPSLSRLPIKKALLPKPEVILTMMCVLDDPAPIQFVECPTGEPEGDGQVPAPTLMGQTAAVQVLVPAGMLIVSPSVNPALFEHACTSACDVETGVHVGEEPVQVCAEEITAQHKTTTMNANLVRSFISFIRSMLLLLRLLYLDSYSSTMDLY